MQATGALLWAPQPHSPRTHFSPGKAPGPGSPSPGQGLSSEPCPAPVPSQLHVDGETAAPCWRVPPARAAARHCALSKITLGVSLSHFGNSKPPPRHIHFFQVVLANTGGAPTGSWGTIAKAPCCDLRAPQHLQGLILQGLLRELLKALSFIPKAILHPGRRSPLIFELGAAAWLGTSRTRRSNRAIQLNHRVDC